MVFPISLCAQQQKGNSWNTEIPTAQFCVHVPGGRSLHAWFVFWYGTYSYYNIVSMYNYVIQEVKKKAFYSNLLTLHELLAVFSFFLSFFL